MSGTTDALLHGERDARDWYVSGTYAAAVLLLVVVVLFPTGPFGEMLYRDVFPLVLFGTPPVVSALSAARGGGLLESIAIGLVPTVAFLLFGRREALFLNTMVPVAVICLGGALVGFLAGYAGRELLRLLYR